MARASFHTSSTAFQLETTNKPLTVLIQPSSTEDFERFVRASGPRAFVSGFEDPYLNLALESYIFKHMPVVDSKSSPLSSSPSSFPSTSSSPSVDDIIGFDIDGTYDLDTPKTHNRLLLYVNKACIVIGRNQNPWRECNLPLVKSLGVPLLRRRSGGGAVVHDSGNVNFSVMTPREEFTRDKHAQMIVKAVNKLPPEVQKRIQGQQDILEDDADELLGGNSQMDIPMDGIATPFDGAGGLGSDIPTEGLAVPVPGPQIKLAVNTRYDIIQDITEDPSFPQDTQPPKISGSAYKIERNRAYHHGTMLLNARLDILKALLHRDEARLGKVVGRGVESVKSPVANLGMDKDVFISTVIDAFAAKYCDVSLLEPSPSSTTVSIDNVTTKDEFVNPLTVGIDDYEELGRESLPVPESVVLNGDPLPVMLVRPEHLPREIYDAARESMGWEWQFGQTPEFTHRLEFPGGWPLSVVLPPASLSGNNDLAITFSVNRGRLLDFKVEPEECSIAEEEFQFLRRMIELEEEKRAAGDKSAGVKYVGKEVAGYVPNDELARWISESIDGTLLM